MSLLVAIAAVALGHGQINPNVVIWRDYKAGAYSKAKDQAIVVMNTPGDYQQYVTNYGPQGVGDGRDVDWGKEELVAIHLGTRATGGFSVEVETIAKVKPNESQVSWSELTPIRGNPVSQVVTSPWTIVRLNRPGTRLTFSGSKREGRLPGGIQIINFPGYDWGCNCCEACARYHQNRLPWRVFSAGDDAPVLTATTFVMNTPDDFASYVRNFKMAGLGDGSDVDWRCERLLAIHLGRKLTPGYQILIDHIDILDTNRVDASYVEVDPTLRSFSSTGPYLIVRIPKVGPLVTFSKRVVKDTDSYQLDTCNCGTGGCRCGRH